KKNLIATPTGVDLIQIIREELLKSAELTGMWEKKLREIEKRTYDTRQFLEELKQMVSEIVTNVLSDNSNRRVSIQEAAPAKPETKKEPKKHTSKPDVSEGKEKATDVLMNQPCPLCGKGVLLKGKTAYGCSEWKNGCTYRKAFE
ncbi:hypothetical protein EZS27_006843, partial [termite gut metagenome]